MELWATNRKASWTCRMWVAPSNDRTWPRQQFCSCSCIASRLSLTYWTCLISNLSISTVASPLWKMSLLGTEFRLRKTASGHLSDRGCGSLLRVAQSGEIYAHESWEKVSVFGRAVVVEASRYDAYHDDTLASCLFVSVRLDLELKWDLEGGCMEHGVNRARCSIGLVFLGGL